MLLLEVLLLFRACKGEGLLKENGVNRYVSLSKPHKLVQSGRAYQAPAACFKRPTRRNAEVSR